MPKLLLAAGGTGGHMFPAQALAEILKGRGWNIAMITDARGAKHTSRIPADQIIQVQAATISPRNPLKAIRGIFKLAKGTSQAKSFMSDWRPDVVAGFGGYPAFPAMRAAQGMNIPTLIHEQNAVLGRVNRVFASKARYVVSGFELLEKLPTNAQHVHLGNPLRQQIIEAIPDQYNPPNTKINLLILGGSLGARIVSEVVPQAVAELPEELRKRLNVVQQTREESLDFARDIYKTAGVSAVCEPFFSDVQGYLAEAHYIIARAGASSVSEISAMGKPALYVPLKIAMDDHQTKNGEAYKRLNAADILPESMFTPELVKTTLENRLNDSNWLSSAARIAKQHSRPDAATQLADLVASMVPNA